MCFHYSPFQRFWLASEKTRCGYNKQFCGDDDTLFIRSIRSGAHSICNSREEGKRACDNGARCQIICLFEKFHVCFYKRSSERSFFGERHSHYYIMCVAAWGILGGDDESAKAMEYQTRTFH